MVDSVDRVGASDRVDVLGVMIDDVTMAGALERVSEAIDRKVPYHVVTLNAEILYRTLSDEALAKAIGGADLVTPDGTGVVWAAGRLGRPLSERVAGVDLATKILSLSPKKGWRVFLYGARPEVLEEAVQVISKSFPGIDLVGAVDGYQDEDGQAALLEDVRQARPDVLLVALGAPAQELFISKHLRVLKDLPPLVAVGVGGTFDVLSGRVRRAPAWVQKLRLEWLYRAGFSRARWKRILVLPFFVARVVRAGWKRA